MKLDNQTLSFDYDILRNEKFTEPWQINFNISCKENKEKNSIKIEFILLKMIKNAILINNVNDRTSLMITKFGGKLFRAELIDFLKLCVKQNRYNWFTCYF